VKRIAVRAAALYPSDRIALVTKRPGARIRAIAAP
jgi:hypothetical protein